MQYLATGKPLPFCIALYSVLHLLEVNDLIMVSLSQLMHTRMRPATRSPAAGTELLHQLPSRPCVRPVLSIRPSREGERSSGNGGDRTREPLAARLGRRRTVAMAEQTTGEGPALPPIVQAGTPVLRQVGMTCFRRPKLLYADSFSGS